MGDAADETGGGAGSFAAEGEGAHQGEGVELSGLVVGEGAWCRADSGVWFAGGGGRVGEGGFDQQICGGVFELTQHLCHAFAGGAFVGGGDLGAAGDFVGAHVRDDCELACGVRNSQYRGECSVVRQFLDGEFGAVASVVDGAARQDVFDADP